MNGSGRGSHYGEQLLDVAGPLDGVEPVKPPVPGRKAQPLLQPVDDALRPPHATRPGPLDETPQPGDPVCRGSTEVVGRRPESEFGGDTRCEARVGQCPAT